IINNYTPEVVDVAGTKTWDDADNQDGKRPEAITVTLFADGVAKQSTQVTKSDEWKYAFTELPKYAAGQEIVYTIEEVVVKGYKSKVNGFDITNSYTPEVLDLTVNKTWDDAD